MRSIAAMAFFGKAGGILRQAVSKHVNSDIFGSSPSVFQMIRCMSTSKVFVGGIHFAQLLLIPPIVLNSVLNRLCVTCRTVICYR